MKSTRYIELAKKILNESDYGLSKEIGVASGTLTNYAKGRRVMDDYTAFQLAEILNVDPAKIIAAANADREKDQFKKEFWNQKVKEYGFVSLGFNGLIIALGFTLVALMLLINNPIFQGLIDNYLYYVK